MLIHVHKFWLKALPGGGVIRKFQAIRPVRTAETAIEPQARSETALRGRRAPRTARIAAVANGTAGISQSRSSMSALHLACGVHIQSLEAVIDLERQRQAHGYLSRRHGQDEHE